VLSHELTKDFLGVYKGKDTQKVTLTSKTAWNASTSTVAAFLVCTEDLTVTN